MKRKYTYKFSDNGYDYFLDNSIDQIVKLPENTLRTDKYMTANAINAENDDIVYQYYS